MVHSVSRPDELIDQHAVIVVCVDRGCAGSRSKASSVRDDMRSNVVCAGINRQEAEGENPLRERSSDPLGPEFCAGRRETNSET